MENIWHKACLHYDVPEDVAKSWYARIHQRLSEIEPNRFYHNWSEMLQRKQSHLQHCKPSIVLAAFFQYYHFDGIRSCIKANCDAFEDFCRDALIADEESKTLILKLLGDKTMENELLTDYEFEANLLQDLDLVILAASPEDYKRYTQLLRREYKHMNDEGYKVMRLKVCLGHSLYNKNVSNAQNIFWSSFHIHYSLLMNEKEPSYGSNIVLQTLLTIPNIFSTAEFQEQYEEAARLNIREEINTTAGTSLTSIPSPSRKDLPFKKFRDNRKRESILKTYAHLGHSHSVSQAPSPGQLVTKKLLRAIKRRQLQRATPAVGKRRHNLKRKLNLNSTASLPANTSAESLEEGEIVSGNEESESVGRPAKTDKSLELMSDDDCICIEPAIEEIIIDDDIPSTSHYSSSHISTKFQKWISSTPRVARKSTSNVAQPPAENDLGTTSHLSPFFKDVSGAPWFETINSEDTFGDYTKQNSMSRKKSLRNARLKQSDDKSNEVIVLDDTLVDETVKAAIKHNSTLDNSVIFVSETNSKPGALDFIPLENPVVANPAAIKRKQFTPKKAKTTNNLFTASEKKQLAAYNTNAYNPSADATAKSKKRMVIIDGSNVAFNHSLNKEFSVKGLTICIEYFDKMGHEVKAVVPQFRLHRCSDPAAMENLYEAGRIVLTPCKNLPGKSSSSYDDRFVLQLASELDAVIVSNDNYRDLLHENPAFKKIIENRVLGFTWCNDIFMVARDPYGKWGPTLQTILNRS